MKTARLQGAALALLTLAPVPALACGGLFCNNTQPVVQQAENILFVVDAEQTHMHVRISYAGPPQEFGWLLPVPRGVETTLSSDMVFTALGQYAARFELSYEQTVQCDEQFYPGPEAAAGGNGADAGAVDDRGVEVLSREPVGPYDRAILDARSVEDLRNWLNENGYQIPDAVDDTLRPYVDNGAVFVAIKLLPGEDTGDLVPLHLSFPGNAPTIPLRPTAVATQPDMGVVVHVLGEHRAIPLNYRHVQINEAAVDWVNGGANYFAVVAQASDEAGGRAFTTDFAGGHSISVQDLPSVDESIITAIAETNTLEAFGTAACGLNFGDPDVSRILRNVLLPPGEGGEPTFLDCLGGVGNAPGSAIDGAAVAARLRTEVNEPRVAVAAQFAEHPYLTRLFTTMSAEEMSEDPTFAFNADAVPVDNVHQATAQIYQCTPEGYYDYGNLRIITQSGLVLEVQNGEMADAIQREGGMTIRQGDEPAAQRIEQYLTAGAPEATTDNSEDIAARNAGGDDGGDDGCGCSTTTGHPASGAAGLLLAALGLGLVRRNRRRG
jgi:MYXO-CTERM domain-containing protein